MIYKPNEVVLLYSPSCFIIFIIFIILSNGKIKWSRRDFLDKQFIHRIHNRNIPSSYRILTSNQLL